MNYIDLLVSHMQNNSITGYLDQIGRVKILNNKISVEYQVSDLDEYNKIIKWFYGLTNEIFSVDINDHINMPCQAMENSIIGTYSYDLDDLISMVSNKMYDYDIFFDSIVLSGMIMTIEYMSTNLSGMIENRKRLLEIPDMIQHECNLAENNCYFHIGSNNKITATHRFIMS